MYEQQKIYQAIPGYQFVSNYGETFVTDPNHVMTHAEVVTRAANFACVCECKILVTPHFEIPTWWSAYRRVF